MKQHITKGINPRGDHLLLEIIFDRSDKQRQDVVLNISDESGSRQSWYLIFGTVDNDALSGSTGTDIFIGPEGADKFTPLLQAGSKDIIIDFKTSQGDKLVFDTVTTPTNLAEAQEATGLIWRQEKLIDATSDSNDSNKLDTVFRKDGEVVLVLEDTGSFDWMVDMEFI